MFRDAGKIGRFKGQFFVFSGNKSLGKDGDTLKFVWVSVEHVLSRQVGWHVNKWVCLSMPIRHSSAAHLFKKAYDKHDCKVDELTQRHRFPLSDWVFQYNVYHHVGVSKNSGNPDFWKHPCSFYCIVSRREGKLVIACQSSFGMKMLFSPGLSDVARCRWMSIDIRWKKIISWEWNLIHVQLNINIYERHGFLVSKQQLVFDYLII